VGVCARIGGGERAGWVDITKVRVSGPLLVCAHGVAREMLWAGYSPRTVRDYPMCWLG
jgi:hypothetical protein